MMATSYGESLAFVRSGDEDLLVFLTAPTVDSNGLTVVLLTGGGWMPSAHRNRMWVRLARKLASQGFHVARFDYRGVGESTGYRPFFELNRPATDDLGAVLGWLADLGHAEVVLVGTCFGGRTSLTYTARVADGEVAGIVLSGTPVEDYLGSSRSIGWHLRRAVSKRSITRIRTRYPKYLRIAKARLSRAVRQPLNMVNAEMGPQAVSDLYLRPLTKVLERNVPTLIMHGTEDGHYIAFSKGMEGRLGTVLRRAGDLVAIEIFDGELHGELTLAAQDFTIDRVLGWIQAIASNRAAAPDRAG